MPQYPLALWASRHPQAAAELRALLHPQADPMPEALHTAGEAAVQVAVRLEASRRGILLFRNNSGALADERGRFVRFGLANDSAAVNARLKSGDLIGCEPLTVTAEMVGSTVGRFLSVECKPPGWRYSGKGREVAQRHWAELITAAGGRAVFATGEGVL